MSNAQTIRRWFKQAEASRSTIAGTWDEISRFIAPIRAGDMQTPMLSEAQVRSNRTELYDHTAINAAVNLAATMQGYLTSEITPWFMFRFRNKELNMNTDARMWLEEAAQITFNHFQDSNFAGEMGEDYLDLVSFGNAAMTCEWEDDALVFQAVPIREAFFDPDKNGRVLRFYRKFEWTAAQIFDKFGKAPDIVAKCDNSDRKFQVIFCIYKRSEYVDGITVPENRPWGYGYVLMEGNPDEAMLDEGGLYKCIAMVPRWGKMSGSRWGYGPGNVALPTAKTLNETVKMVLKAAEKVIDPPSLVQQRGLLSDLDLSAGGQSVVRDVNGIRPYESGARFDVSALQITDLRTAIEKIFLSEHTDVALSDRMSATEYQGRHQRMARMLGGTLGRLARELFDPMIELAFDYLVRNKRIPPPPPIVRELGEDIDIVYTGPLAVAQRTDQLQSVVGYIGFAAQMEQAIPGLLDPINPERFTKWAFEASGLPFAVMRTENEVKQIQQTREAQKAQAAMAAGQQMEGEAMKAQGEGLQALQGVEQ